MIKGIRTYFPWGGFRAIAPLIEHKLLRNFPDMAVRVPGIIHPVWIRVHTSDLWALQQVLIRREYECTFAGNPKVIIDGGANIGTASIFYANRYPEARIYAVEPDPSNFMMLRKNTLNYPAVTAVWGALWNKESSVKVAPPEAFTHWGVRVVENGGTVPSFTISSLMRSYALEFVDILKLDIEGAECEVLSTSAEWIESIGMIAIETHDRFRPGCSAMFENIANEFPYRQQNGDVAFASRIRPSEPE
jgi:FkbM family methyltransferase